MTKKVVFVSMIMSFILIIALGMPAYAQKMQKSLKGEIAALDVNSGQLLVSSAEKGFVTIGVDRNTAISKEGLPAQGMEALLLGDRVEVRYNTFTGTATRINAFSPVVEGVITALSQGGDFVPMNTITITPWKSRPVTLTIGTKTLIFKNEIPITWAELQIGDVARASYDGVKMVASKIVAYVPIAEGTLLGIYYGGDFVPVTTLILGTAQGKLEFKLNRATILQRNGAPADLKMLVNGDYLLLNYDPFTMTVRQVDAFETCVWGTLVGITTPKGSAAGTILIIKSASGEYNLQVTPKTVIERNGVKVGVESLRVGDSIQGMFAKANQESFLVRAWGK